MPGIKKLTISLGLIGILAVMAALIIAVGSLGHGYNVESMEIDLTFNDRPSPYQFVFTCEKGRYIMKYKPDYSDEWQEYKISQNEYYSVAGVDISKCADNEDGLSNVDYHIAKRYKDGHTQELNTYAPEISYALIDITDRCGAREPVYLRIKTWSSKFQFENYNFPYQYFERRDDKFFLIFGDYDDNLKETDTAKIEITEEDFNTVMNTELPKDKDKLKKDRCYYQTDSKNFDGSYPYVHAIIRLGNDGYYENAYISEEFEQVDKLLEIIKKYEAK